NDRQEDQVFKGRENHLVVCYSDEYEQRWTIMPVKTIIARVSLLFAPFVIWQMVELLVLPVDLFTFRFWEALVAQRVFLLPGPFYPNTYLEKYSAGDLASRGPRRKLVRFHSDQYGRRHPLRGDKAYEIAITGDSNVVGS